jgi:dUTP pyrophosphatase
MSYIDTVFKRTDPRATIPFYATAGAGCFDIFPLEDFKLEYGHPQVIDTGLAFEIPPGYVMFVFSRSGHGFKYDVCLANGTGIIDSDYRDSVKLKLRMDENHGHLDFPKNKAVAQAIIIPFPMVRFIERNVLNATARGTGGFGSTDQAAPAVESAQLAAKREEMTRLLNRVKDRFGVPTAKEIIRRYGKGKFIADIQPTEFDAVIGVCRREMGTDVPQAIEQSERLRVELGVQQIGQPVPQILAPFVGLPFLSPSSDERAFDECPCPNVRIENDSDNGGAFCAGDCPDTPAGE